MKKIILSFILATSLLSFTPNEKPTPSKAEISQTCKHGQCQATAKSTGKQCKHCVSNTGDKFCYQHK